MNKISGFKLVIGLQMIKVVHLLIVVSLGRMENQSLHHLLTKSNKVAYQRALVVKDQFKMQMEESNKWALPHKWQLNHRVT